MTKKCQYLSEEENGKVYRCIAGPFDCPKERLKYKVSPRCWNIDGTDKRRLD